MKYLIVGDYHDARVYGTLKKLIEREKPNVLVSLGDFDVIGSINDFLRIKKTCGKRKIRVVDVPGNHDHAILSNLALRSESLANLETDIDELHTELDNHPKAKEYLESLMNNKKAIRSFKKGSFNAAVVHGAYEGDLSSLGVGPDNPPGFLENLWFRLCDDTSYAYSNLKRNFEKMHAKKQNLMIRGHDHTPFIGASIESIITFDFYVDQAILAPKPEFLYVIAPGAFCNGFYATMETGEKGSLIVNWRSI